MITKAKHLYVLSLALLATALILLLQNPVQAAWYNNGWAKRIKITIDSAKVNGDLTNFPVFVDLDDLPDAFFDTVNGSGADIVVTDNGGTTVLKRELVSIDTTANDGELWFKAASLSSTSNSDFYIYYTNGDAALTNDTDTWPSGYIFVSHFETDPTGSANDVADSTSNNNDGSSQGTMAGAVAGQIGNGYDFDETDDYVDYGDISTINGATTYSISAWVYTSSSASAGTFFAKGSSGDAIEIWDDISGGPTYYFFPTQDSDDYSAPSSNTDVWEHVVMVYNGNEASADDALKYYLNGSLQTWDSSTSPASSFAGNTDSIYVGYDSVGTVYHGGKIDEIRLTTEDLSEAWVATEYNNQKSPDTFYSVGSIENRALGDSGWSAKTKITVLSSAIDATLTDFPVYVDLSDLPDSFFSTVNGSGADIRVTKSDQGSELAFELVAISTTDNTGELWFKADSLSSSSNTDFWIFYGNGDASAYSNGDTYGSDNAWDSNFIGVYHFQTDPSSSVPDSTGNSNSGTSSGSMGSGHVENGHIGKAYHFDGSDDVISLGDITAFNELTFTMTAWAKRDATGVRHPILTKEGTGPSSSQIPLHINFESGNHVRFKTCNSAGTDCSNDTDVTGFTSTSDYYHVAVSRSGTAGSVYKDSVETTDTKQSTIYANTGPLKIGARNSTGSPGWMDGYIDEVHISSVQRSDAWIIAEFNNQNGTTNFYTIPDIENPTVSTYSPTDGATEVSTTSNLVLTFSEAVYTMTGNITIKKLSDDSTFETIPVGDARVTGNGTTTITINPANGMAFDTSYYVNIASTCFDDSASNSYAGITDNGTWNFASQSTLGNLGFSTKQKLTVLASAINGDLTNFPVYVDLDDMPDSFFSTVNGSGADIRVTKSDQGTELAFELVAIDTTANDGELWFKADSISSSSNTDFWIFYGNGDASAYSNGDTYGRDNVWTQGYLAVYHMEEDPDGGVDSIIDSTGVNHGDPENMSSEDPVTGQLGNALDLDGTNEIIDIIDSQAGSHSFTDISDNITVSFWVYPHSVSSDAAVSWYSNVDTIIEIREEGSGDAEVPFSIGFVSNKFGIGLSHNHVTSDETELAATTITANSWYHAVFAINGDTIVYYLNGSSDSSDTLTVATDDRSVGSASSNLQIGSRSRDGGQKDSAYYDGLIDELHITNETRSMDWVSAEFNNQNGDSFYVIGDPSVSTYSPSDGATGVTATDNLVITFDRAMYTMTGNITIKKLSDDSTFETIPVGDARVTGNGSTTITINPTNGLDLGTNYYVNIAATCFDDTASNSYTGITDNGTWNFTTLNTLDNLGFSSKQKLTILASAINGDLTNFPVYVDLDDMPDTFFSTVNGSGADIRVTKSDQGTELAFELVSIDTTANDGELWFKADSISSSSNTDFWIFYDNGDATAYSASDTYGSDNVWTQGFAAVWHLEEDGNTTADGYDESTSNDADATGVSLTSSTDVTGRIGKGQDLDGSADYLTVDNSSNALDVDTGDFTVSSWAKLDTTTNDFYIILDAEENGASRYTTIIYNTDTSSIHFGSTPLHSSLTITDTNWYYLVLVADRDGNATLYKDLSTATISISGYSGMDIQPDDVVIGARFNTTDHYFNGILDEIRVATELRSYNWVSAEYYNQNGDTSDFYTIADTANPTVSTYSPTDGASSVSSTSNLVITFDEAVYTMTGNITIKKLSDDSTFETIPVGDARVTGNGSTTITINPANGMAASTDYYVNIAATCFDDAASNSYAGITDNGTWNFTTAAGGGGAVSNGWTNSAWGSRLKFTVNGDQVNGDLTDFPVYIDLSDLASTNFFSNVRSDGGEIRITQGDGLTLLATELVSIDTTNNQGELWFKAPFLDGSADTSFYIYYNNANATTLNAAHKLGRHNVWTNGYVAVYHFNEDPNGDVNGSLLNSVSNSLHGTPTGSMTSADKVAGQIGNGSHLDGSNDYFTAASTGISMDNGTVSAWANKDVNNADFGIWQIYTSGSDHLSLWCDGVGGGSDDAWSLKLGGTDIVTATTAITSSGWHHVATSYDFTNDNYEIYQDGVNEASSTTNYTADTLAAEQDIGLDDTGDSLDGILDELHIADKIRTEAWIDTEYNNQNSASTFYTIGSNEGVNDDGLPKPTLIYPRNRQDRFPLAANLFIEFNENVQAGSGNITIKEVSNGGTFEAIAIGSATISGARVTINPSSNLASGIEYYVEIDDGAVEDTGSNAFIGFRNNQSWRFTTEGGSSTTTTPSSLFIFGE